MTSNETVDSQRFDVLGRFCTGVTVIASLDSDGAPVGFACQSFAALSLTPPLVLFCPRKRSYAWAAIERCGRFSVNILAEGQQDVCARFGSREPDKFVGIGWSFSDLHLPVLDDSLATIQCAVAHVLDGGDHVIVTGRVLTLVDAVGDTGPLLFYRGRYAAIEPEATSVPWHADLEHYLATSADLWL